RYVMALSVCVCECVCVCVCVRVCFPAELRDKVVVEAQIWGQLQKMSAALKVLKSTHTHTHTHTHTLILCVSEERSLQQTIDTNLETCGKRNKAHCSSLTRRNAQAKISCTHT